jgi:hypothetical protein
MLAHADDREINFPAADINYILTAYTASGT